MPTKALLDRGSLRHGIAANKPLATPGFHHLHLNSMNPEAASRWYAKEFPSTSKTTWGGMPALKSPNNVLVLFTKVDQPPATQPQTAFWHFGWHVTSERQTMARLRARRRDAAAALHQRRRRHGQHQQRHVPGTGGVLGLTKAQIADAKKNNVKPAGGAGFAYIRGPDDALIEVQGDMPAERFNHVHMYHEEPFCPQLWYQKHLNVPIPQGRRGGPPPSRGRRPTAKCRAVQTRPGRRSTRTACIALRRSRWSSATYPWAGYTRQSDKPLASTRGHTRGSRRAQRRRPRRLGRQAARENVKFLEQPYKLGDTRAVMIEGPSREALELVEVR